MTPPDISSKAGFVALIGRPNAGKSSLINAMIGDRIALTSRKAGATRKRQLAIVMYENAQIIFIDTPGLDKRDGKLNEFMRREALSAIENADLSVFLADMADQTRDYENFLAIAGDKKHIVALTKSDHFNYEQRIKKLAEYQSFSDRFLAIAPISAKKKDFNALLFEIARNLPDHPFYYDPDELTDATMREIYAEMIREAIFDSLSDEAPYACGVEAQSFEEGATLDRISATIFAEKPSHKAMAIGKNGATIKRIGRKARIIMEQFSRKKVFLELKVVLLPNWRKQDSSLAKLGYKGGE
ncbi:MAG: GTPase Era [Helicobacteraceae bacterium]|jgi:GTP-binding protein Era|nr:GTPase Era [Helicobacteraceae bacterium]